jgi:signal transduction histidine kinase/HAMP domain-containing protein
MSSVPWASLRIRLLLLVGLAVGPIVGLVLYTAAAQRQLAARQVQGDALRLVRFVSDEHSQLLEGARQLLTGLAQISEVRHRREEACSALFADVLKRFPIYSNVGAVQPDGELFCSGVPRRGPVTVADRYYFQRSLATQDFAVGEYAMGRITGKATLGMAYPAVNDAGTVQAVVFAALDVSWLHQLVAKTPLPEGAAVLMLDHHGTIVTRHPDPELWAGRSMPEAAIVKAMLAHQGEGTAEATGLDGVPRFYAFSPLRDVSGGERVYVSIGIPTAVAFAEVRRLLVQQLVWVGVVTGMALGAAWAVGNRVILRRMQALVQATQRLAAGDLRARTGLPHGPGEFGHLAQAFDAMAAAIQQAYDTLERRVQERTADLRHANDDLQMEIAERRRAEEALAHSLARLEATLEATADGILVTDDAGKITHINRTFIAMWRIPDAILTAQDAAQLQACLRAQVTGPDGLPAPAQVLPDTTAPDGPAILDCADGRVFECAAQPQRVGDTRVGTVWSVREITQRRAAERLKDEFVSTVSHELRTPLTSLRGFADLLLTRSFAPEEQREFVTIIHRETLRLTQLINDFLDLQRIESGRQVYDMARVELEPLLRETIALFHVDDAHSLHLDVPEPLPPVEADADRIRQVLMNLLSNAVKFSPHGGEVTLGARHEGGHVRLWVADRGIGIPPKALPHLFSKFFRVDNQETRSVGGTGLGLALVRENVEAHHGRVWVESANLVTILFTSVRIEAGCAGWP